MHYGISGCVCFGDFCFLTLLCWTIYSGWIIYFDAKVAYYYPAEFDIAVDLTRFHDRPPSFFIIECGRLCVLSYNFSVSLN